MKFKFSHNNFNVLDLEKSLNFYRDALQLIESRRVEKADFTLVFLKDRLASQHSLELTYLKDRKEKYNLGDNEIHLAFEVDDFDEAFKLHQEMGVIAYHNQNMGIYFIEDPDGYWIEILPLKK